MTEMTNDIAANDASEMLDEVFSEPSGPEGPGAEGGEGNQAGDEQSGARTVPLATFLGMRDEAKAAGAENAELKRIIAMMQQPQTPQQPDGIPDPATDPAGYAQYMAMLENQAVQAEVQQAHQQLSFVETSLDVAKNHLGGEGFHEAYEMARAHPLVAKEILLDPDPGAALVEFHHYLQQVKAAAQNSAGMAGMPPLPAYQPQAWTGAAAYQPVAMAAPPPSLAGARGGNASALAPLISDDPVDDILR